MNNKIKIIGNGEKSTLGYFIMNDKLGWVPSPNTSKLSREEYINASIAKDAFKILDYINATYARGTDDIVEIILEGINEDDANNFISETKKFPKIKVVTKDSNILVCGKVKSGKSTLIKALSGVSQFQEKGKWSLVKQNKQTWYEIGGLDIEEGSYNEMLKCIKELASEVEISNVIYCVKFDSRRLEKAEEEIIGEIKTSIPEARVLVAVTNAIDDIAAKECAEKIQKDLPGIVAAPVLAEKIETRLGLIEAYGVYSINNFIFEGLQ